MNQTCRRFAGLPTLVLLLFFGCGTETREAGEWPQWRGPSGHGATTAVGLPLDWDAEGSGIRWQVDVPDHGISSPIVSGDQIFLTGEERRGTDTVLKVLSFDLATGQLQWETTVFSRPREKFPYRLVVNSPAAPTPLADGEFVYAYFGSHLAALDYAGGVAWVEEIDPLYMTDVYYGAGSSLVSAGDHIIVFRDREVLEEGKVGWLAAFDKKDGRRVWRKQWADTCCSFTTPLVIERPSGTELVVSMAGRIMSYDPKSGELLWKRKHAVAQPVASPVVEGELLCAATGAHNVKSMTCWRLKETRGAKPKELWSKSKGVPETASPVLYRGLIFTVNDRGIMNCHDAATGRHGWIHRLPEGPYYASLVAGDGKIYATSQSGLVSVVAAEPAFRLLGRNQLPSEQIIASPAVAAGCLLVRTDKHLLCVEGAGPGVEAGSGEPV